MAKDNTLKIYDSTPDKDLKERLTRIAEAENLRDQRGNLSISQAIVWLLTEHEGNRAK